MKFIINKLMFKDEDSIYQPNHNIDIYEDKIPSPKTDQKMFLFGPIQDMSKIPTLKKTVEDVDVDGRCIYEQEVEENVIETLDDDFDVSSYLEMLSLDGLNYSCSYFKLACQLDIPDIGNFIRSDSGKKLLTGQILDQALFSQIRQRTHPYIAPDDMLFLAPPRDVEIRREFRLWVLDDKVVASTEYSWDKDKELMKQLPESLFGFASDVIERYSPSVAYVMDIALMCGWCLTDYRVIEYNGFSTSGFYDVDVAQLLTAVEKYYEGFEEKPLHRGLFTITKVKDGDIDKDAPNVHYLEELAPEDVALRINWKEEK